jgi:hypothetical protein
MAHQSRRQFVRRCSSHKRALDVNHEAVAHVVLVHALLQRWAAVGRSR